MKINKFIIFVMLILAIFAVGAVNASQNITQTEDILLESSLDAELLDEGSYYDNDFFVSVKENYAEDKSAWNDRDIIYISSYSQKNGTFKVLVNDEEKSAFNVTDGYFSLEDDGYGTIYGKYFKNICPNDLGLDVGTYNIKVRFEDSVLIDTSILIKQKEDFDIYLLNPYYCEQDYWTSPSFIIIDSNHWNNGTLEIFVNGTRKIYYDVSVGNFTPVDGCANRSRYIAASELFECYGKYHIQINFTENGIARTLRDENVVVAEFEPTTDPKLEAYLDLYTVNLPADNIARIYLPREATGTLYVSYNNVKNHVISYSKGYGEYYIDAWNLNHLGENTLTFTYVGEDYGTLKTAVSCTVVPGITAPFMAGLGEKFKISMITHEWVNGKFNVYDYNSNQKGRLLASGIIANRVSAVELSSNTAGLNKFYLEFAYPGGYYPLIQEVYIVKNSHNIKVDIPSEVNVGFDVPVNVTAPASPYNFVYISVDGGDYHYYSMENGSVLKTISGLSKGHHTVSVQYNNGYYSDGQLLGDVYSNTFTFTVGLKSSISAPQISTVYNVAKNMVITLKDSKNDPISGRTVTVKLNGATYTGVTDKNGKFAISVNLPAKTYSADISFAGDDTYIGSVAIAKVVVAKAKPKLTAKTKKFKSKTKIKKYAVTLKDNRNRVMKKVKLTLKVKGKVYRATTNTKGKATFKINKLFKKGTYRAKITFKATSNYFSVSKSVKIKIK